MYHPMKKVLMFFAAGLAFLSAGIAFPQDATDAPAQLKQVQKLFEQGNYKESGDLARKTLDALPSNDPQKAVGDLWNYLVQSLVANNRVEEYDEAFEFATKKFSYNLYFLCELTPVESYGYMIDGKFKRGSNRGNAGQWTSCEQRDRVQIYRLMAAAIPAAGNVDKELAIRFYLRLASLTIQDKFAERSWQLQSLTDLTKLPDYNDEPNYSSSRPPVHEDGSPVFYSKPASFGAAKNDGQRFRWALEAAMALGSKEAKKRFAMFLINQFDFSAIDYSIRDEYFTREEYRDYLYNLKDNETVAELADGTRKITMPDEYNYFRMLDEIGEYNHLAELYLSRLQYEKAADYARKAKNTSMLQQIEGNCGFADGIQVIAHGKKPVVTYHFRNAKNITASVSKVNTKKAVEIMQKSLSTVNSGGFTDAYQLYLHDYNGVQQKADKNKWVDAIEKDVDSFNIAVTPRAHHWETDCEVTLPMTEPGAYLVNLQPENSLNDSFTEILVWITPDTLTMTSLPNKTLIILNDSETGKPIEGRSIKVINYETRYANTPQEQRDFGGRAKIIVTEKEFTTDKNGVADAGRLSNNGRRLVLVQSANDIATFLPNSYVSYSAGNDMSERGRTFMITDRPAYRPGDTVKFSIYRRTPSYKEPYTERGVLQNPLNVEARDAQGKKIWEGKIAVDTELNAAKGEFKLPDDVSLGQTRIFVRNGEGSLYFAVEEYKKPEYLLTVTMPEQQIETGGLFEAELQAKYYFGAPMAGAKIKYKVFCEQSNRTYPFFGRFDWLFGRGYWICSTMLFDRCFRNDGFGRDLIVSSEGIADEDGKLTIPIDTSAALSKFGKHDYKYTVQAEVSDESNRVISGSGSVITAAQPFYVDMMSKTGFARTGKPITLVVKAVSPDGKEIAGKGKLSIYAKSLNKDGVPERTGIPLKTVDVTAGDENGISFVMDQPGVYEVVTEITSQPKIDPKKAAVPKPITCTGTYPLKVSGFERSGDLFSELPIEITTDKGEYLPGDEAEILVSTKIPGYSLYFFPKCERKSDWEYVDMTGSSHLFKFKVDTDDRPNIYVKVIAVGHGEILTLSKMIAVPPVTKMLDLNIDAPKSSVKPGSTIPLTLQVTDATGKPVQGAVTLTVYDKSLDAIAQSRIPEINSYFWNWKRYLNDNRISNLDHGTYSMVIRRCILPLYTAYGSYAYMNPFEEDLYFRRMATRRTRVANGGMVRRTAAMADDDAEMAMDMVVAEKESEPMMMKAAPVAGGFGGAAPQMQSMAANSFAAADMAGGAPNPEEAMEMDEAGNAEGDTAMQVRTNFLDTAFYAGLVKLSKDGKTTVEIPVPDNLTTWKIRAWTLSADASVGEATAEFVVSKELIARLEIPRFLINGDKVNAVANIHNNTDKALDAEVMLKCDNPSVKLGSNSTRLSVPANGHTACNFELTATEVGEVKFTLSVKAAGSSDALELKMPVLVKGIDKQVNGFARLDKEHTSAVIPLDVPKQRKPETTALTVQLAPGAAKAMVELLPYLAADGTPDVFGVVNRFVPTLATSYALSKLGIDFKQLDLKPTNRDELYKEYMERYCWKGEPVPSFDAAQFARVNADSLKMILGMVNSDGGWGWFSGHYEVSYADTTAYVVNALLDVQEFGDKSADSHIKRGLDWLKREAAKRVADLKSHPEWGVSNSDALIARVLTRGGMPDKELLAILYDRRTNGLAPYGLSMLALALPEKSDERAMVVRNLTQFLKVDNENQTAYLNIPSSFCWFWYGEENETNAAYLDLLLADNAADPTAHKLANYLVTNIRNSPWRNSTRAIGAVVRSLGRYIVATNEGKPDMTAKVFLDGKEVKSFRITQDNLWNGEFVYLADSKTMDTGKHELKVTLEGTGVLYVNSRLNYFTLEDKIDEAGLEMRIKRNYYRLVPDIVDETAAGVNGSVQGVKRDKFKRVPLKEGEIVRIGELVEVELISTAKNDYDYVRFEDHMPAGFEYVSPVSGYTMQWGAAPIYREYRERGAKFYLRNMARGQSNIFYRMRAQLTGRFTALPAIGSGVYAPELKCNSTQFIFELGK